MLKVKLHYTEKYDLPSIPYKGNTEVKITMQNQDHIEIYELADNIVDFVRKMGFTEQSIKDGFINALDLEE